jgi:Flp pilus assembly protein CpaB
MDRLSVLHRRIRRLLLVRRRLLAAAAAAVAVAAGLQASAPPPPPTTRVLTAAHDIGGGRVLTAEDLTRVAFRPGSVPDGVLRDAADAVGRTTSGPLRAGEPITDVRLVAPSLVAGYPGRVAVPVRIADSGAVRLLRIGDRVDVLAADPRGKRPTTQVAVDAPVVALPAGEEAHAGLVDGGLVVLAVTDETARDLAAAGVSAYLSIVLTG